MKKVLFWLLTATFIAGCNKDDKTAAAAPPADRRKRPAGPLARALFFFIF